MGGVHYILVGDFYQLPPPMGTPLYKMSAIKVIPDIEKAGVNVYRSCTTFVELIYNYRAAKDPLFMLHLENLRKGTANEKDYEYFQTRTFDSISDPQIAALPQDTLFVSSTKKMCQHINQLKVDELTSSTSSKAIYIWAQHRNSLGLKTKSKSDIDKDNSYVADEDLRKCAHLPIEQRIRLLTDNHDPDRIKLLPCLRLALGSRVMLTINPDPKLGLFHGAMGTVVGLYYHAHDPSTSFTNIPEYAQGPCNVHCSSAKVAAEFQFQLPIVIVQFDSHTYTGDSFAPSSEVKSHNSSNIVPIAPIHISYKDYGTSITRTQLPLVLSSCVTIHKCQGLSLHRIVWILGKFFTRGLGYVASGRATTSSGLYIIRHDNFRSFSESQMNDYQDQLYDIHEEYERLRNTKRIEARRIAKDNLQILDDIGPVSFSELPQIAIMENRPIKQIKESKNTKKNQIHKKFQSAMKSINFDTSEEKNQSLGTLNLTDGTRTIPGSGSNFWSLNPFEINDTTNRLHMIVQIAQQDAQRTFCRNSTYGDVASLYRHNWLTGTVMNHILSIILQSNSCGNIVLLPDYFYSQLSQVRQGYNFANVSEFITRKFVENPSLLYSDIIFPVHIPGHWILAILASQDKTIYLIDSMKGTHVEIVRNIIRWYHDMSSFLDITLSFNSNDWNVKTGVMNSPLQTDNHSCGVFAIMTAIYWIRDRQLPTTLDWTQKNMPSLRLFLAHAIFTNSELPEYPNILSDPNHSFIDLTRDENENNNSFDIEY